ncbi:unnamed protein product, partial [marine sediment metagenome]
FLDKSRPLYRSAGHYPLGPIDEQHWMEFIRTRFLAADKAIDDAMIGAICQLTEGHPFYTQHLCHVVWELTETGAAATEECLRAALGHLAS